MALQLTRVYLVDGDDNPIEAAVVTLHHVPDGVTYFAQTDVDGMASFTVEEDLYTLSVTKAGFISPPAVKVAVSPPPGATSAAYNPPAFAAPGLISATDKNVEITVDPLLGGTPVLIDVTGGDDIVVDESEIVTNINAALALVNVAWGSVASNYLGEIRLTSPTTGATSGIVVRNDGMLVADGTQEVFGLDGTSGNVSLNGEDAPIHYNDFDVVVTEYGAFVASNPNHCVLWGRFWRHELSAPLQNAVVWIEVDSRPKAVDVGIDVGDSFYAATDENGYVKFEMQRGTRARMYLKWLDKCVEFTVPDASSYNLDKLISPYVEAISIVAPVAPATLPVAGTTTVGVQARLTDGTLQILVADVTITSSDALVVTVANRTLTAVAPGNAQITASHVNAKRQTILSVPLDLEVV